MTDRSPEVRLDQLDIGLLSYFVGTHFNRRVMEALAAHGITGVRQGLGYVIQHLIAQPRTATELAQLMGVSQQAASKSVKELLALGYVEERPSTLDGRAKLVHLSEPGWEMIGFTRGLRNAVQADMLAGLSRSEIAAARKVLVQCLQRLGGEDAVRMRRVKQEIE